MNSKIAFEPDPRDQGSKTLEKYGAQKIAIVRYFLRYYRDFHRTSWNNIIGEIGDFTEASEKYNYCRVEVNEDTLTQFGSTKNAKADPFRYRVPSLVYFEAILDFLLSEDSENWLSNDVLESLDMGYDAASSLAAQLEGPDVGSAAFHGMIFGGSYHARGTYNNTDSFIEFHLIPVPDHSVARLVFVAMAAPKDQLTIAEGYTKSEQIIYERMEAQKEYGWLIGAKSSPGFGMVFDSKKGSASSLQMIAAALPMEREKGKKREEELRKINEKKARDIIVMRTSNVAEFDARKVREARSLQTQAIGPQPDRIPEADEMVAQIHSALRPKILYMSLITTKF
jgi:hypothetical protein